jgi:putative DNA primase/helicase
VSELFRGFVGSENAAAVEIDELAAGDFATGDLPGTFINWGDDMAGDGGGQLSDLSLLKKATGGSEIRANEKYEKTFNFKNEAAMFFSANEPPRIGEKKPSIQDRIYPIEMPYRFKSDPDEDDPMQKKKVPNVSKGLLADDAAMRGLLTLAVDHAKELKANEGQYSQPESPEERLEKYNRSADPIVKFAGRALREADADSKIRKDDAHRVFREFTESWEERSASERGFKRQLPGATSFEMESARSRALANPDDGEDRVMCWKRVQWSETARKQMPDWMADRYADHFDNADTTETADEKTEDSGSNPTLKQLDPGRHTVEATVAEQLEPKPWLQGEGTLVDDGELLDYQARGDSNPLSSVSEGDRVQIKNAKVTTDQDGLKLLEVTGVCEVQVLDSSDPDQTSVEDAATGEQAATDGGESSESKPQTDAEVNQSLIKNATETVNAEYDSGDEITAPSFAGRNGLSPKQGEAVLEHLATEKGLLERLEDGYRVL